MAHNAYVRPGGIFNFGIPVTHGEFTLFDQYQFKNINGDDGGTWAPSSPILIGGAGLSVGTGFSVLGNAALLHNVTIGTTDSDTLTVNASALFGGQCEFVGIEASGASLLHGAVTLGTSNADSITINGSTLCHGFFGVALSGSFQVVCAAHLDGNVVIGGGVGSDTLTVNGTSQLNGAVTCTDTLSIAGDVAFIGAGTLARRIGLGSTTSTTYSVSTLDEVVVESSLGSSIVYDVDNVGASTGKRMRFSFFGGSTGVEVGLTCNSGATGLVNLKSGSTGGNFVEWADIVFIGGTWRVSATGRWTT